MRKSTDIRVVKTQKALLEALEKLIKNKKLSCITITELCTEAKINRNTFYYHYNNIYELLEENKRLLIEEMNEIPDVSQTHSKDSLIGLCKCLKRYPRFLNILISPNCDLDYFNDIFTVATEKTRVLVTKNKETFSPREYLACQFCNAGTNALVSAWILNGMVETPEEIADIITDCAFNGPINVMYPNRNKG
jgi:AcrR family transcriptional regulator